jgi:hypothetical protein
MARNSAVMGRIDWSGRATCVMKQATAPVTASTSRWW